MISTAEELVNLHRLPDHQADGFSAPGEAHLGSELDSSPIRMNGTSISRPACFPQSKEQSEDYFLQSLPQLSSCEDGITDPVSSARPHCSYSCLIAMALKASRTGALLVSEIYRFIEKEYPFFRTAREGWKNSIRHTLSLNTAFCKAANPYNLEVKKGFRWMVNPKYQVCLEAEIEKFLKMEGRKLIEMPDSTLFEEPSDSPAAKKPKVKQSSTSKARKRQSSKVSLSTMDISKVKQEIASAVIEKLSGLVTEGSKATAQMFQPFVQHLQRTRNYETIAATTLNQHRPSQGLLQQVVDEQTKIHLAEHADYLNDTAQTQQKQHKCESRESQNHCSFMPQCSVPSQRHASLEGTLPEKAGLGYVDHPCPAFYPPWLQRELPRQPPLPSQGLIKEPPSLQQLDFFSSAMQPPPMANCKVLESMQQVLPVQLASHLLQRQRPLVQLVAKRLQATQEQAMSNNSESLQNKDSNSNFRLWPSTTQESETEEDNTATVKNVLNGFHPFKMETHIGLGKSIDHVNGVCNSFKDISESGTHLELSEDEDPLPEMQDTEYRMYRSYSTSVESLHSQATTDVGERSAERSKPCEKMTDLGTQSSPKSSLICLHNASSSLKQNAIDHLSYRFSLKQIDDSDGVDEDESPLIGQKRKLKCASAFSDSGRNKLQREDSLLSSDEFSAAIAPFDITKHLINASCQVREDMAVSMDTSDSSDSSTSTLMENCNANLTNVTELVPSSTLANGTTHSWCEDSYPFRLLNFLRNHSASEEGTHSAAVSVRDSDESLLSSISSETTSLGQCSSSNSSATSGEFGDKVRCRSCVIDEEHRKSKHHNGGRLIYQSSLLGSTEYDFYRMCAPSHICTKGPRYNSKKRY